MQRLDRYLMLLAWLVGVGVSAIGCATDGPDEPGQSSGGGAPCPGEAGKIAICIYPQGVGQGPTRSPDLIAFQDGDGAWTTPAGTDGVYHVTTTSDHYAVAVGCIDESNSVQVTYGAVSESTVAQLVGCSKSANLDDVYVMVNVVNTTSADTVDVWFGGVNNDSVGGAPFGFDVHKEPADIFVRGIIHHDHSGAFRLLRGPLITPTANETYQFDLGAQGKPPETHVVTVTGAAPNDSVTVESSYGSQSTGCAWDLASEDTKTGAATYATLNAAQRAPNDLTCVTARDNTLDVDVTRWLVNPTDISLALPPPLSGPAPAFTQVAPPTITAPLPFGPPLLSRVEYRVYLSQPPLSWSLSISSGWLATQPSRSVTTPDLSALPHGPELALQASRITGSTYRRESNDAPLRSAGYESMFRRYSYAISP